MSIKFPSPKELEEKKAFEASLKDKELYEKLQKLFLFHIENFYPRIKFVRISDILESDHAYTKEMLDSIKTELQEQGWDMTYEENKPIYPIILFKPFKLFPKYELSNSIGMFGNIPKWKCKIKWIGK